MKLLIITQKVDLNDGVLGFFHDWLLEFSKKCEEVFVICLYKGDYNLPKNVKVFSLGKEDGVSRVKYIINFLKYIISLRNEYSRVFVHMNQIYVILGGFFWKSWGKKISLFYTHRQRSVSLWIAEKFTDIIFTAAKESFTLKSNKVSIIGHGIDVKKFSCQDKKIDLFKKIEIVSIGRITKIKNLEVLIKAAKILKEKGIQFRLRLIGEPVYKEDFLYKKNIEKQIKDSNLDGNILFTGNVSNVDLPKYYCEADLSINLTPTGGIDKVVLESMSSGVLPIVSNEAFRSVFGKWSNDLVFSFGDSNDLAKKIIDLINGQKSKEIIDFLKREANTNWSTEGVVGKIIEKIK